MSGVASRCRSLRSNGRACGVPALPVAALETNPWLLSDTFFNRLLGPDEEKRDWIFFGPVTNSPGFHRIWKFYENKACPGFDMRRTVYYLQRTQRSADGVFRLTQYPVTGIQAEAFYFLLFKPTIPGEKGNLIPGEEKEQISEVEASTGEKQSNIPLNQTQTGMAPAFGGPFFGGSIGNTEEELTRIKDVKGGEEDKVLQEEMTIPTARARVLEQQDDLCKLTHALGDLTSVCREVEEFLRLVKKEVEYYNTMVEREDVDGEKAATKAYKAARGDSDQSDEVAEAEEISSALMEKVDGLIQNLEKEVDDVGIKIGKGWQLLDRDQDGKVTPDEVAAAAMYLKHTLANEGLQQLISSLSKDKEGRIMVEHIVRLGA